MNWHALKYLKAASPQERIADAAAAGSIGTAGWTWLANLNGILQVVATLVAIGAGWYAIQYHRKKIRGLDEDAGSD